MAASKVITAHVVVEFSEGENFTAFVEVDDREGGFNGGKTTFIPGQDAYLLLFKPTGFSVIESLATAGTLTRHALQHYKEVEEYAEFPNEDSATVRYPISKDFSYRWVGSDIGTLTESEFGVALPARPIDNTNQKPVPEYRIGVAQMLYNSECEVWKLTSVPFDVEKVMCFFVVKQD